MSSFGIATISAVTTSSAPTASVAPVGAAAGGVALGGLAAAALAGAVAVGAGIVIAQGLMLVGEKMEANYQEACRDWTKFENTVRAESRANAQQVSNYLTSQLECLSVTEFAAAEQTASVAVNQQELERALARTRTVLADTTVMEQDKATTEQKILAARLRAEIKAGRGILPPAILAEAEQALSGSSLEIQAMRERLEQAWSTIQEQPALETRTIQQARQLFALVSTRLRAIEVVLRDVEKARSSVYQKRLHKIENKLLGARDALSIEPPKVARDLASEAQKEAELLLEEITALAHQNWNELRARVNEQIGILDALRNMVAETESAVVAESGPVLNPQRATGLKQRIETLAQKARDLLKGDSVQLQSKIAPLTVAVENLKQAVFTEVKTGQQQTLTHVIQSTLAELGYQSDTGEQPVIRVNGDITRVEVMASRGKAGGERDDKVISFDISRDGKVSYDFSGYAGEACLKDAQEVFDALCKKGIYLVNEAALPVIQSLPVERLLKEVLQKPQFQATPTKNKTQAELAETLKGVLDKMGYPNVRVSSVGGSIELEAFEGAIGYRVVMSPEGEVQIFKDANQTDITHNPSDPITKASQTVQEASPEPEMKERKKSYMASRKGRTLAH